MGKMDMVKVVNQDKKPYEETFAGRKIVIPGRGSIEMRRDEAYDFLGTQSPALPGGGWVEKNLEIEEIPGNKQSDDQEFVCNFDGMKFPTKAALDKHLESHKDQIAEMKGK